MTRNPLTLTCYVISDGRAGIENQALGLAQAFAEHIAPLRPLEITPFIISHNAAMKAAQPLLQFTLKSKPQDYGLPTDRIADIAIGCGRQAIAPLLALKQSFPDIMTVYIQDPRIDAKHFDLIIAPEHDKLSGGNIETMIGAPNRITAEILIGQTLEFAQQLLDYPMPRAAMLIGGDSKHHSYKKQDLNAHLQCAYDLLEYNYSVLISCSRRTPEFASKAFQALARDNDNIWLYDPAHNQITDNAAAQPNPYFAFLGGADIIFVTQDSTNMLTDACTTGKPVFMLPVSGDSGKFTQLYAQLKTRCHVQPYNSDIYLGKEQVFAAYEPLEETKRLAQILWSRYQHHQNKITA